MLGGFLVANALVHVLAAWLVYPVGQRLPSILLGALSFAAAAAATVAGRTTIVFFVVLIAWAATTGVVELAFGLAGRRRGRIGARDEILIGAVTILLAVGVLLVSPQYVLDYTIKETGGTGVLTGITIAVGLYGATPRSSRSSWVLQRCRRGVRSPSGCRLVRDVGNATTDAPFRCGRAGE